MAKTGEKQTTIIQVTNNKQISEEEFLDILKTVAP